MPGANHDEVVDEAMGQQKKVRLMAVHQIYESA